jgi:hypothetical protein
MFNETLAFPYCTIPKVRITMGMTPEELAMHELRVNPSTINQQTHQGANKRDAKQTKNSLYWAASCGGCK